MVDVALHVSPLGRPVDNVRHLYPRFRAIQRLWEIAQVVAIEAVVSPRLPTAYSDFRDAVVEGMFCVQFRHL
jgi:hypothetical protein